MTETYGIENVKKVFKLVIDAGNEAGLLLQSTEGKWYEKLLQSPIVEITKDVIAAIGVNWKDFPKELTDISETEMVELKEFFVTEFDIPEEETEKLVEEILALVLAMANNAVAAIALAKRFKKQ